MIEYLLQKYEYDSGFFHEAKGQCSDECKKLFKDEYDPGHSSFKGRSSFKDDNKEGMLVKKDGDLRLSDDE
jgi:hypothetical protein